MEVKEVLYMNKGDGENSYHQNSSFTQKLAGLSKPALQNTVQSLFSKDVLPYQVLNVADLGCSSTPTTFSVIETVIESVKRKCKELNYQIPEFQYYLNDLAGNDFNTLFKGLLKFTEKHNDLHCFVMGTPGSFHGRLFPANTMHLIYSSYAVSWLSKVPRLTDIEGLPLNKGKIYISDTSSQAVKEAYLAQFQVDFGLFLKSRSQEMIHDGRVFLIFHGRLSAEHSTTDTCFCWEPLSKAIADLVSLGLISEEKLDSFDVPDYVPSIEEVKDIVNREGSFEIELLETFPIEMGDKEIWINGEKLAKDTRCLTESLVSNHFGEEILDKLYDKLSDVIVKDLATCTEQIKVTNFVLVLRRM
ncbi:probable caffeine synthase 2 [Pistacia vera]|uniref:probable caffeine synthase 2 n=1 Tax=Pistacia vera TaxID=55513 RepID=UPI0012637505|nr:probable caffeine synthase 2 [Pistacia vera]